MAFLWALFGDDGGDRTWGRTNISSSSLLGSGSYVGITELAQVTDPPRKYRTLTPNYAGFKYARSIAIAAGGLSTFNRTNYNTAGVRTQQSAAWMNASSGSPWGSGSGRTLLAPGDSLETADWAGMAAPYNITPPVWTKERIRKYVTAADFPDVVNQIFKRVYSFGMGFGRLGGLVGTIRGFGLTATWNGAGWTLTFEIYNDDGGTDRRLWARLRNGNTDPGLVGTTDSEFIVQVTGQFPTATLFVPPDCSVRFMVSLSSNTGKMQVPQPITVDVVNGDESPSTLTEDAFDRWLYLPAAPGDLPTAQLEERLCQEDTPWLALVRSGTAVPGTSNVARTTALAGGVTAESNAAITFTGTAVQSTRTFAGRTAGVIYRYTLLTVVNTIGLTDYAVDLLTQDITATGPNETVTFDVVAPLGKERRALVMTDASLGPAPVPPPAFDQDMLRWWGKVLAAGGALTSDMLTLADAQVVALKAAGVWTKLVYYLPLIGTDLTAALVPLRDRDQRGNAVGTALVAGDFSYALGLQGNGTTKFFTVPYSPGQCGTGNNGGLGWVENNYVVAANLEPMGNYNNALTNRYVLDLRTTSRSFRWGLPGNGAGDAVAANNGRYYGQRSASNARQLWRNNVSLGTNVVNDATAGSTNQNITGLGSKPGAGAVTPWAGRCAAFYLTDGTLTGPEIAAMDVILQDLMTATARPN